MADALLLAILLGIVVGVMRLGSAIQMLQRVEAQIGDFRDSRPYAARDTLHPVFSVDDLARLEQRVGRMLDALVREEKAWQRRYADSRTADNHAYLLAEHDHDIAVASRDLALQANIAVLLGRESIADARRYAEDDETIERMAKEMRVAEDAADARKSEQLEKYFASAGIEPPAVPAP